ncbi:hypothetical protein WJX84_001728 [Apatococcus fuscideae]|uniref:DRBM domain-containing protein n=1 Tax=Apatococcus fuscideae TaxID=2026836 RepID=A0AAW1RMX5_9CHLO
MPKQIQPKADLNTFYTRVKRTLPIYTVKEVSGGFECEVQLAAVEGEEHQNGYSEKTFKGQIVKKKKDAMQAAAAAAHAFVTTTQVYQDCKPYVASLWETTKKILSDAGLRRETELEGVVALAQSRQEGWAPTQHLTLTRALRSWFQEHSPGIPATALCMAQHLRDQLPALQKPEDEEIELSTDGQKVRRKRTYLGKGQGENQGHGLRLFMETLETGTGRQFKAVRIPADIGQAVEEVLFEGGVGYWSSLAQGLQCSPQDMLMVGKVGKIVAIPLASGQQPPPDSNQPIYIAAFVIIEG